jgi:tetratricopeptide (TPR) repeat protein
LYRKEERWEELFNLYYGQLEQTQDVERRAALAVEMGRIARDHVKDLATAVQWLDYALQLEPSHAEALQLKYDIYSGFGDWPQVTQILGMQFQYATTPEAKIDVLLRRAVLYRDTLGQSQEAIDDFVEVLNQDPHHDEAYEQLTTLLNQLGAWDQLYDVMGFRATIIPEDERKQMFLDMAEVARKLGDGDRRIDSLEKAYNLDPSDLDVVSPLLDATIAAGQLDRAEPMLDNVIDALTEKRRMKEVVQFYHLRGKLAEQRGLIDQAIETYEAARKIDATYVPNLLSLGKLLYAKQDWDSALKILQTLLLHQMSIKDPSDKLDMYYYLGQVRLQTGDARRAKDMFNRALGVDSSHQPSLDALSQIG